MCGWSHRTYLLETLKQGFSKGQKPVWFTETVRAVSVWRGEMFIRGIAITCRSCFPSNVHTLLWSRPASEGRLWTRPYAFGLQWFLYSGVYTVLTLDQCWPFMLQSCIIALLVVCGWWPSGHINVCWVVSYPFVDKWLSVHVSYVLGCCHRAGAEHHHTNSGPNYFLL